MLGDPTLFARADEVSAAWRFVTPILEAWSKGPPSPFPNYPAGTWGPGGLDGAHRARRALVEAPVSLSLHAVEREINLLWAEESERAPSAARVELLTLAALVSEPGLLERAQKVVDGVVRTYPSRTIVAVWKEGSPPSLTADAALHRPTGNACGDAISLEAIGAGREWLPENIDRLALSDLPVCIWWVGDLPDFDDLFDRLVVGADIVVVNSGEMDLRDLEKLSRMAQRSHGRYAIADLTWIRLHPLQDFVARFFDDEAGRGVLSTLHRMVIEYSPRENDKDAASTLAGLFFGWTAQALGLRPETALWKRGRRFQRSEHRAVDRSFRASPAGRRAPRQHRRPGARV